MAVKRDWRKRLMSALPATATFRRIMTYDDLEAALLEAAGKRRMHPDEYAMRAVRAFVEHDLDIDDELREIEPNLRDMRRVGLSPKRYRGKEFGRWRIERLGE